MTKSWLVLAKVLSMVLQAGAAEPATGEIAQTAEFKKGRLLFVQHWLICHLASGQGVPGTYPPLTNSDFLAADRSRAIRIICEGLSGAIEVNGRTYHNVMPAVVLNDQEAADVLTFVNNSWGNHAPAFTSAEVATVRKATRFPTYDALLTAASYQPLPKAPAGLALRELTRLNDFPVRLASGGDAGPLLVLSVEGKVLSIDPGSGAVATLVQPGDYADLSRGSPNTLGFTVGPDRHLYLTANQKNEGGLIVTNEVTIFRSRAPIDESPLKLAAWFETNYPYGVGPYNHGVSHVAFGPDGYLYVASGSRTDGNEKGSDPRYSTEGETPITACIWRLDPKATPPKMAVYARGVRNVFGFAWDGDGNLFTVSNGPDAPAPEELDHIVAGGHFGFPFQFSNWTNKPYAYTPDPPRGITFKLPVANLGPAAGGSREKPLFTFDPHSSPAGMVWLNDQWPASFRNSFLVTRYGNLLAVEKDVGFDLLQVQLTKGGDGVFTASMQTLLAPLGRPIDVITHRGFIYVAEYTRPTNFKGGAGWLPGRIIELKPTGAGQTADR